jgi:UDPglucose 6-dehydrogenase
VLAKQMGTNFIPSTNLKEALENSEIVFYCVGTPMGDDGAADLGYLYKAIEDTLKHVDKNKFKVLVIKSTIPPSTTKEKIKPFIEKAGFKIGQDVGLANNPEFLREGYAWDDFINPDRIVIGTEDEKSYTLLKKVYSHFNSPLHNVSYNTGEYIKYLSNTLLSTLISFANEQSMIAHSVGDINIAESFKILHQDKRWSGTPAAMTSYVYPGCGFGGYCLPKDTNALVALAAQKGYTAGVLQNVLNVNNNIKDFHIERILKSVPKTEKIGVLGLSFKPNSDDVRDTPANSIISKLLEKGYKDILAYDPIANTHFDKLYKLPIQYAERMENVVNASNTIVILTGWSEFKEKKELLAGKNVFDLRYVLKD